ncbi:MAG: hypothetical protein GY805_29075 [Chloroflexi bacterium]|nr:hypothetical protein [Chloroflexota bacterium]
MEPKYYIENRYSFVVDALPFVNNPHYEVDTPETRFERNIQCQLAIANRLLMTGKYSNAVAKFRHLRGLISKVIYPKLTAEVGGRIDWSKIDQTQLIDGLVAKSAEILQKTPITATTIPAEFRGDDVKLPAGAAQQFATLELIGIQDNVSEVGVILDKVDTLIEDKQFDMAGELLSIAITQTDDRGLQGVLLHDLAIMQERAGNRDDALCTIKHSERILARSKNYERQVQVINSLAGIQLRGGDADAATKTLKRAGKLEKKHNLFSIANIVELNGATLQPITRTPLSPAITAAPTAAIPIINAPTPRVTAASRVTIEDIEAQPVQLMAARAFSRRKTEKQLSVLGSDQQVERVQLNANAAANLGDFYTTVQKTRNLGFLMQYLTTHTITVAYLPHIYFWVIPMAIGDCHAALGSYEDAESEYLSTLNYRYLNEVVESVNLWLRLAELYLDWGDRLYRVARNNIDQFAPAKEKYERILLLDNTLDTNSPLYQNQHFDTMRDRAEKIIQRMFINRASPDDNPRIAMALLRARMQLHKIANNLNFLGMSVHIPPFSFEHLQNVARYFSQHAGQVEQMYIQFKSTAENDELREDQMAQQADLAAASVELERLGVNEAREGVDVAEASANYANVQHENAEKAEEDFDDVRWELLELDALQAWSSAAAVDEDDEVQQKISGYSYYNTGYKDRSDVLYDLARQRTCISHDLEADRLQREINSADAYRDVANEQVQQAQARVEVAEQRVVLAQLQEQHAHENLAFLTGREFSSAMWYNLAREARRLARRYLDMAIEVAVMMEVAYRAETGRDLRKIKFEYGLGHLNSLLGAEALLLDIDYFTLDHVRTKSKKAQMKQSLSFADNFPLAFERLLSSGRTFFETTLAHFDRRYPGFYLQKVKQVEVVFVGLNGAEGTHGTLRNIGVSQFRKKDGAIVNMSYPADVMPLSEYSVRQDAIVFQLDSKELRLFENNGVATMWQLDLPLATNTFDLRQILDIQLVIYYDGFFDVGLEQQILAALPANDSASRGLSLRLYAPDELFFLRSQGSAEFALTPDLFPANQTNQSLTAYTLQAIGDDVAGLRIRVDFEQLGGSHTFQLDNDGMASSAAFPAPLGQSLFETWRFSIDPADNPDFDLATLTDLSLFVEYDFTYRN